MIHNHSCSLTISNIKEQVLFRVKLVITVERANRSCINLTVKKMGEGMEGGGRGT